MGLLEFFNKYFAQPIKFEQGYTYINTIVYALVAFGFLVGLSKIFKKTKTKINPSFFLALTPFIILGSFGRVLVDKNLLPRTFWTVSPGVYLSVAILFILAFLVGTIVNQDTNKIIFRAGSIFLILSIIYAYPIRFVNIGFASLFVLIFGISVLISYSILKGLDWLWALKPLNFIAISAQLFDAINTSFLVQFFGAVEKHPLPRTVMEFFGNAFVFIPLKLFVILSAIYFINKEVKDKTLRRLLILSIAILGTAQGLRNILGFIIAG